MFNGIPQQVQAGADAADKLIKEQAAALAGDPVVPINPDPNAIQDPDLSNPEPTGKTVESLTAELQEANQRLSVLQGKYNAEIKALGDNPNLLNTLKAENKRLSRQVNDYSKIISDQQHELATKSVAAPEPVDISSLPDGALSEDDLAHLENEGIGGKTLDIIKSLIVKTSDTVTQQRYGDVSDTIKSVQQDVAVSKSDRFFQDLTEAVPNWQQINGSEENPNEDWLNWLDGMAPYQDRSRAAVLHDAQGRLDVKTCADIFNDYIRESGVEAVVKKTVVDPALNVDPASLLEPATGAPAAPTADAPAFTMAEYQKHYEDFTKGLWKGREKEWKEQTAILDKAFSEGRIK